MANAIYSVIFKLKKNTSIPDYLAAAKKLNDEYISKQKGYVSWQQCVDKDTWADLITFETMEDALLFQENSNEPNEHALAFYSFIKPSSCKANLFTVEKTHQ